MSIGTSLGSLSEHICGLRIEAQGDSQHFDFATSIGMTLISSIFSDDCVLKGIW